MTDWTQRAEDAANDLSDTDRQVAELRVKYERDKRKAKRTWSAIYLRSNTDDRGKSLSVEARKAVAETHADYQTAQAAEMTSLLEFEALRNSRDTANTIIEFWRSYNKASKEGLV